MAKPIINQFITKHVELYKRAGKGTVPKLMFPTVTIRGIASDLDLFLSHGSPSGDDAPEAIGPGFRRPGRTAARSPSDRLRRC